jgi:hypothetical protein
VDVVVVPTWANVHELPEKLPVPVLENVTVPGGNDFGPVSVSDTVVVHVVVWLTTTDAGEQVTFVEVDRFAPVTVEPVASELVACSELPP